MAYVISVVYGKLDGLCKLCRGANQKKIYMLDFDGIFSVGGTTKISRVLCMGESADSVDL